MTTIYRIIEQGTGLAGVQHGAEVWCRDEDALLRVVSGGPHTIHTDDARGNYVLAECEPAERDVTSLTDAEFAALPQVRVVPEREHVQEGDRVEGGEGEDYDTGTVLEVDGAKALVGWDTQVQTWTPVGDLTVTGRL